MLASLFLFLSHYWPILASADLAPPHYKEVSYSELERPWLFSRGVHKAYEKLPSNYLFNINCNFYDLDMLLVGKVEGYLCKDHELISKKWFFFEERKQLIIAATAESLALYDGKLNQLWSIQGNYTHDFIVHPERSEILAMVINKRTFKGIEYDYFGINSYNFDGKLLWSWSAFDIIENLKKIGAWKKDERGVDFPISTRIYKRNRVLKPNTLMLLKSSWQVKNGPLLPRGTLLFHENYTDALVALSPSFEVIWSYRFDTHQRDSVETGAIHTPLLLDDGVIAVYDNYIPLKNGQFTSGIAFYDSSADGSRVIKYTIPSLYKQQHKSDRNFGSIQLLADGSWLVSTGTEYGGVVHLDKDFNELFRWINPLTEHIDAGEGEVVRPIPVYRAAFMNREVLSQILRF